MRKLDDKSIEAITVALRDPVAFEGVDTLLAELRKDLNTQLNAAARSALYQESAKAGALMLMGKLALADELAEILNRWKE